MENTKMLLQVLLSIVLIFILALPAPAVKASPAVHRLHDHSVARLAGDSTSPASTTTPNMPRGKVTPMVAAGGLEMHYTVGLKSDGTVVATGVNHRGQCDVGNWTDIAQIAAGSDHTVGLKSDGTVVAVGSNIRGQCNVGGWTDIVQVATSSRHTVGLKADGTVLAVGDCGGGQCNVGGWDLS